MTVTISADTLIGDLVTDDPRRTRVLDAHGIDYCCGGRRTLAEATAGSPIDLATLLADLDLEGEAEAPDWTTMDTPTLARHIVDTHHAWLWEEMPRLDALAQKVAGVHGGRHPELTEVRDLVAALVADLTAHLTKEERILFPSIAAFYATDAPVEFPFGRLANPIRVMLAEHDAAGDILARLREISGDFTAPADGCGSYTALYAGLAELEDDLHLHIHKENNVLFPRVVADEEARLDA